MGSFEGLIVNNLPALNRYAWRLTLDKQQAEDLVQDSIERALNKSHLWEKGSNMRAWLFTIMHNVHLNVVRRDKISPMVPLYDMDYSYFSHAENVELKVSIYEAINFITYLPEKHQQVIFLIGVEGVGYKEAAELLDVPLGTIMSRLYRAREYLKHYLFCSSENESYTIN